MEYADALAEAGSGKTCAVDVQAADVCHVVSASFVWVGQKNRDGDFMHGAVVVVLNADGKAFLAHNMVLCDDDQWTCELVGFPAQGLSNDTFTFVLDVCATLALVSRTYIWRPLNASLGKIARSVAASTRSSHSGSARSRARFVELKVSLNEGQSQVVPSFSARTLAP